MIQPPVEPEIHSAHDALAVSLHDTGRVDLALMAELLGRSPDEVAADLGSAIWRNPASLDTGRDVWVEAELARLERLHAAHYDDQFAVRRAIQNGERDLARAQALIPKIEADLARRVPTRGESFRLETRRGEVPEREKAGRFLLDQAHMAARQGQEGRWRPRGSVGTPAPRRRPRDAAIVRRPEPDS